MLAQLDNLIRDVLLDDDPSPVYLLAWGGASTIARALKSIQDRYPATIVQLSDAEKLGSRLSDGRISVRARSDRDAVDHAEARRHQHVAIVVKA